MAKEKAEKKTADKAGSKKLDLLRPVRKLKELLDGIEADYPNNSSIKKTLIALLKLRRVIFAVLMVVIVASVSFFAYKSSKNATVEMSLNYEEAANGLNPNATRFNAYILSSREIVEKAIRYCGIDPANVDVDALCNAITVSSTNNKAFSEGDYYISTTYKISLKMPSSIKGVKAGDLLSFICKAFKDNLYANYTENRSILEFDINVFNDKEYLEIAELLDLKAQQIEKYLNTRVKQSKSFVESQSNETFKSLVQKVEDIRSYDIDKYRTFVIEAGCSYDKTRYINSLAYINLIDGLDYDKNMTAYTIHNEGIEIYDDDMISVVMIPSIDESKKNYYMSKTKTGMDYIASKADSYLSNAQETAKKITINKDIIAKMLAGTNDTVQIEKANQMILSIREKLSDLSKQIEVVDKAYVNYKTKDYLTFKTVSQSIIQRFRLDYVLILTVGLLFLMSILLWIRFTYAKKGGDEK